MRSIFVLLILFSSVALTAQRKHYSINIADLQCSKTTEEGEDEVYMVLVWRTSYGNEGSIRVPDEHWSMNDGNHVNNDITPGIIFGFDLAEGENIDIVGHVMEQDDGTPQQYADLGKEVLRLSKVYHSRITFSEPATKNILDRIAGSYNLNNSDDWMGTFIFHIESNAAGLTTDARGVYNSNSNTGHDNSFTRLKNDYWYFFYGDGSAYRVIVNIKSDPVFYRRPHW